MYQLPYTTVWEDGETYEVTAIRKSRFVLNAHILIFADGRFVYVWDDSLN